MSSNSPTLAVLGPRQSGKTCLAVGLSTVNTPKFTVASNTFNTHLGDLAADIERGCWPAANNKGDKGEVALNFQQKGRADIPVSFVEFAGERLQTPDDFKKFMNATYPDGLDGAVVLVNPGDQAFAGEEGARKELLAHYNRILTWLRDLDRKPFVALTITADDRITADGDLADRRETVEEFVAELENILGTSGERGIEHKRFHVTVTGPLAAQDKPKLASGAENTSAEPFLWLLDKLKWEPIRKRFRRKVRNIIVLFAILAAIAGTWRAVKGYVERRRIEDDARRIDIWLKENGVMLLPSNMTLDSVCEMFNALDRPLVIHFKPTLAAIAPPTTTELNKTMELMLPLYGSSQKLAKEKAAKLEPRVWELFNRRIERDICDLKDEAAKNATNVTEEAIGRIDALFAQFVPKFSADAIAGHENERKKWESDKGELRTNRLLQILIDVIEQPLNEIAGEHGEAELVELFRLYGEFAKITVPKGCANLVMRIGETAQKLDSRMEEEFRWMIGRDLGSGLPKEKAESAAQSLLERLCIWQPATDGGRNAKTALETDVKERSGKAVNAWLDAQRRICTEWVKMEIDNQPHRPVAGNGGLWNAYKNFARNNARNPFFADVAQKAVYDRAEVVFEDDVKWFLKHGGGTATLWGDAANFSSNWKNTMERFDAFRQLCREMAETDRSISRQSSWAYHFALLCYNDGRLGQNTSTYLDAFPQRIVIDSIVASADYHGKLPYKYKYTTFGAKASTESFNRNGTSAGKSPIVLLPFEKDGRAAKDSNDNAVKAAKSQSDGVKKVTFSSPNGRVIDVHAFERVALQLVATDWNHGTGAHQSCRVLNIPLVWSDGWAIAGKGRTFDLSFELKRWSGDKKPKLALTVYGHVEGSSMFDLLGQARASAKAIAK